MAGEPFPGVTDQSYNDFMQGQQSQAQNKYDFWSQQFSHFNPQATQMTPVDTTQGFNQATADTMGTVNKANKGNSGTFNPNMVGSRVNMANTAESAGQNLQNQQQATAYNEKSLAGNMAGGLGRMGTMGNYTDKMAQMPIDRQADMMALEDTANSKYNAYESSKPDFFSSLLGGAGKVGGTALGNSLAGSGMPGAPGLPPLPYSNSGLNSQQMNQLDFSQGY